MGGGVDRGGRVGRERVRERTTETSQTETSRNQSPSTLKQTVFGRNRRSLAETDGGREGDYEQLHEH